MRFGMNSSPNLEMTYARDCTCLYEDVFGRTNFKCATLKLGHEDFETAQQLRLKLPKTKHNCYGLQCSCEVCLIQNIF